METRVMMLFHHCSPQGACKTYCLLGRKTLWTSNQLGSKQWEPRWPGRQEKRPWQFHGQHSLQLTARFQELTYWVCRGRCHRHCATALTMCSELWLALAGAFPPLCFILKCVCLLQQSVDLLNSKHLHDITDCILFSK